ncbi:metalloregulator ArsR/SmtB family transcription factor [Lancefieldella sp. Marseille-Q7238]|uniref:ArsR/SmtB family transcription factor n=1 Tax=Lancefieldella sp. Marseille-Q7238 TaxID=3022127 RepID=UPI0024A9FBD6|nr:metalloregulator ArsR/SmtB family transcription factor [Lancefieldella sp. Marseille-Q7238]
MSDVDEKDINDMNAECGPISDEALRGFLNDDNVICDATQIFDALSDFTRFQILGALTLGEKSVTELQDLLPVSQSATSHQLRLLRDRGLVTAKRDGRRVIYSLADEHVITLISVGLAHAAHLH